MERPEIRRHPAAGRRLMPVWAIVALAAALVPPANAAAEVPQPEVRLSLRGTLALPAAAVDQDGETVVVAGLSGVAWLGDDRYVAIMDNGRHLLLFRLVLGQVGEPLSVAAARLVKLAQRHDYEDIAPCPGPIAERLRTAAGGAAAAAGEARADDPRESGVVLVCEEDTPAIRAFSLADGRMLTTIPLPDNLRTRRPNRGLESLAIDPDGRCVWTANEEALPADGPAASSDGGTVVRLTRLPVPGADASEAVQAAYLVDPVHRHARVFAGPLLSGLVALVSLGDDRLLVLERGAAAGLPPFSSRIYLVDVGGAVDVSTVDRDLATRQDVQLEKRLLWSDALGVNLEGLCAGPPLEDGNRALVGIADNGGMGTPNQLVTLSLHEQNPAAPGSRRRHVGAAVPVGGLTSP